MSAYHSLCTTHSEGKNFDEVIFMQSPHNQELIHGSLWKLSDWLKSCFFAVESGCFFYITLLALTAPAQDNKYVAPLTLALVLGSLYVAYHFRSKLQDLWLLLVARCTERTFLILQGISFVIMLLLALRLQVKNTWDYGTILNASYQWARDGVLENKTYFAEHENNQLLLFLVALYDRLILSFFPSASQEFCKAAGLPVNCLLIQAAIQMTYQTAKLLIGREKALTAGLLSLTCAPYYLYSTFIYTDTTSLLPIVLIVYLYLHFSRTASKERYLYLAGYLLVSLFSYFLKASIAIATVATVLDYIFHALREEKKHNQVCLDLIVILATILFGLSTIQPQFDAFLGISAEDCDAHRFPKSHYVMMALNQTGGYNQGDVDLTKSQPTMEQRVATNHQVIKERLEKRGWFGTASHIFYTKWRRTWAWPTCAADDYVGRTPLYPGLVQQWFTTGGKYYKLFALYAAYWWALLLIGLTRSAWQHLKGNEHVLIPHLTAFGALAFFCFWECNPRYLVTFLPILILCAADGLDVRPPSR